MCIGDRRTTIATCSFRSDVVIEPVKLQEPADDAMARFDKLLMKAAKKKKKEIIKRHGQESFDKRVAKIQKEETKDYETTIRELYESVGKTPPEKKPLPPPPQINVDEIATKSSKFKFTKSPNPKNRRKRVSTRRSLPDAMNLQLPSIDDSFSSKESIKKEEKGKRRSRSKSPGKHRERSSCSQSPGVHKERRANRRSSRRKSPEETIEEANRIIAIEGTEQEPSLKKEGFRQRRGSLGSCMLNFDHITPSPNRKNAIQDMEREVSQKKAGYRQRRGSFGSSMDNCDNITKNVRDAVGYWEEAKPLRRMSVY